MVWRHTPCRMDALVRLARALFRAHLQRRFLPDTIQGGRTVTELEQLCHDCKAMHENWYFDDNGKVVVKCDTCPLNQDDTKDNKE